MGHREIFVVAFLWHFRDLLDGKWLKIAESFTHDHTLCQAVDVTVQEKEKFDQ